MSGNVIRAESGTLRLAPAFSFRSAVELLGSFSRYSTPAKRPWPLSAPNEPWPGSKSNSGRKTTSRGASTEQMACTLMVPGLAPWNVCASFQLAAVGVAKRRPATASP